MKRLGCAGLALVLLAALAAPVAAHPVPWRPAPADPAPPPAGGPADAPAPPVSETTRPPASAPPTPPPTPTPSFLELAERLRRIGSYGECAVEALRHAYLHVAERAAAVDRAALCLSQAGRFTEARRLMLWSEAPHPGGLDAQGRLRICLTEVFLRDIGAPICPDLVRAAAPGQGRRDALRTTLARHTLAMRALQMGQWDDARARLAAEGAANATHATWLVQDRELLRRHDELPRPSPWVAGALSAVVPGLGRAYLGRWQDGIMSFLLVGVAAGLSAYGFHEDGVDSVRGWLLGGTAALFYVGNIYGSAIGAVVQRREREDELLHEIEREHRSRLDP